MIKILWLKKSIDFIPEKIALKFIDVDILTKIFGCLLANGEVFDMPIENRIHYLAILLVFKDELDQFIDVHGGFVEIHGLGEVVDHSSDNVEEIGHLKQKILVP